uniref:Uncharacterized protein n=1 Tax=Anguilla anguilla TaxID=7936 RepID=A0A0E9WEX7_ANGAN
MSGCWTFLPSTSMTSSLKTSSSTTG